ncbi:MAG: DUF362 domain-containing protein [Desulfotignum sp.]|nr:DUF362 domain-containing protein [Desulfotignum sp.]
MHEHLYVIHGNDPQAMTCQLLEYLQPFKHLPAHAVIGIKPNLVTATPAGHGATTHPQIVEAVVAFLQAGGFSRIKIIESAWVGENTAKAFKVCGYTALSKKYGIPLKDLKQDEAVEKQIHGMDIQVCRQMETIDYLINVPLIKGHCQTRLTCALKNLKGVIPDAEKRRFHRLGLHRPIALLNTVVTQHLIIADGICPDPFFEEGGRPSRLHCIAAGCDPVLMDSWAARVLGLDPADIPYIEMAVEAGVGQFLQSMDQIVTLNTGPRIPRAHIPDHDPLPGEFVHESQACSVCRSSLISALNHLNKDGKTPFPVDRIAMGQGHQGSAGDPDLWGIGDCTADFVCHLPGCPPAPEEISAFLRHCHTG